MTITLVLKPEVERALTQQAATQGLEVSDYALSLLEKAAQLPSSRDPHGNTAIDLIELFAPLRGIDLERDPDLGRDITL